VQERDVGHVAAVASVRVTQRLRKHNNTQYYNFPDKCNRRSRRNPFEFDRFEKIQKQQFVAEIAVEEIDEIRRLRTFGCLTGYE